MVMTSSLKLARETPRRLTNQLFRFTGLALSTRVSLKLSRALRHGVRRDCIGDSRRGVVVRRRDRTISPRPPPDICPPLALGEFEFANSSVNSRIGMC